MPTAGPAVTVPFNALRPERRDGTLLDLAREMPGEWTVVNGIERGYGMGVRFVPWSHGLLLSTKLECSAQEAQTPFTNIPEDVTIEPFRLHDALRCSVLSTDASDLDERLLGRFDLLASAAIAQQLVDPTQTNSPGLGSSAAILAGSPVSVVEAFARLEDHLAVELGNALGMIHLAPSVLALAVDAGLVSWRDGKWVSPAGHTVVADAGYAVAAAPPGTGVPASTTRWVYATGQVWYSASEPSLLGAANHETINMSRDQWERIADQYVVLAFDPQVVGAISVSIVQSGNSTTIAAPTVTRTRANADSGAGGLTSDFLYGWFLEETSGSAAAVVRIRFGDDATDVPFIPVKLAAGESVSFYAVPGIPTGGTVFFDVVSGAVDGTIVHGD